MKVECAACQAKYQIPDERVAGRKLKIRCRKCGGAIVVRGDQLVAPEAPEEATTNYAAPGYATAEAGEWHVSIEGEQHGPYPTAQMGGMLRDGQLAWDAHVWREGYGDWKTAGDSDTLVRAVASAHDTPATGLSQPAGGFEDDPTRMVQGGSPPPAEALQPVARSTFAQRSAQRQSQTDLAAVSLRPVSRAPQQQQVYAEPDRDPFAYADPRVSAAQSMTGERHEDSVLFSTRNLQQATRAPSTPSMQRAGYAGGEGSGLIDIRALAALARTSQAPAAPSTNGVHTNGVSTNGYTNGHHAREDAVMTMAHQTGAFGKLDSLAPIDRPQPKSSNAVPIAIVLGSAMVAAAAFMGVYLTRGPRAVEPEQPVAVAGMVEPSVAAAAQPVALPSAAEAPAEAAQPETAKPEAAEPAAEEPAAAEAEKEAAAPAEAEEKVASKRSAPSKHSSRSAKTALRAERAAPEKSAKAEKAEKAAKAKEEKEPAASAKTDSIDDMLLGDAKPEKEKAEKPEPASTPDDDLLAAPAPKKQPSASRSIDDLLDGAVDGKGGKPKPEASAASAALADTPSRDEVKAAMKAVEGDVKACGEGQTLESPTATVAITVTGSTGKVTGVRVTGIQGTVGSCVARAVRGASFPKFAKPSFSINFPFRLK